MDEEMVTETTARMAEHVASHVGGGRTSYRILIDRSK